MAVQQTASSRRRNRPPNGLSNPSPVPKRVNDAAMQMARARHNSAQSDEGAPAPAGLPVSETIVNQTAPDPDPDR
jgi:hypothetical protein